MIILLKNNARNGISSVMGDRYVKSDDIKKVLYVDANNFYTYSMCEPLHMTKLKLIKMLC